MSVPAKVKKGLEDLVSREDIVEARTIEGQVCRRRSGGVLGEMLITLVLLDHNAIRVMSKTDRQRVEHTATTSAHSTIQPVELSFPDLFQRQSGELFCTDCCGEQCHTLSASN